MGDKIRPALTAEEWDERIFSEREEDFGVTVDCQGEEPGIFTVTPVVFLEGDHGCARVGLGRRQRVDIERRHAVAALALYNQPFGFTRGDVVELRWQAMWLDPTTPAEWKLANGYRNVFAVLEAMRNLVGRIEALLPPQP